MADEPQDQTEEPQEADDAAVEEPSPSGAADDDTAAAGDDGPAVEQDADGVAEATEHSTKLSDSEKPNPLSPGQPTGVDPGTLEDRDAGPQL